MRMDAQCSKRSTTIMRSIFRIGDGVYMHDVILDCARQLWKARRYMESLSLADKAQDPNKT